MQPGTEQLLDLTAATWLVEPRAHPLPLDDDECREAPHSEALDEVWTLPSVDEKDAEGAVVPPTLQYLGKESLHLAALPRER